MIEEFREWTARYIVPLFLTLGMIIAFLGGFIPLYVFFNAPNYSFQPNFSGFGIARNQTYISPLRFVLSITTGPPELYFSYSFSCAENGTYNFLFWFPFKIVSEASSKVDMSFNATAKGSAVWLQYQVDNVHYGWTGQQISGVFSIENTFQSGTRGSYMFVLPFGLGVPHELVRKIQMDLGIPFVTPSASIDLSFGVRVGYLITQTFPQHSVGPNTWTTPTNRTITKVGWNPKELSDSITVYCQNPNEMAIYQSFLFIGGLGLGIGVPIVTTTLYDATKEWTKKPSKERQEKEKRTNQKEKSKSQEEKTAESHEQTIIRLIRFVDRNKPNMFKSLDVFRGDMAFSFATLVVILSITEIFLFFSTISGSEKITIALSFLAFAIAFFSFIAYVGEGNVVKVNLKRFENCVEQNEKTLLKALIKMKVKNPKIDLEEIYKMNKSLFSKEKLLERLYE